MKGLLIKDYKLIMVQKNFFFLILAIVLGMILFTDNVIFPVGFLIFIESLFTLSTISYDDFDNGNAFLFTLPFTRNTYVIEKYCFGLLLECGAWLFGTLLGIAALSVKGGLTIQDFFMAALLIFPIVIVIQAVTLPFQLKFGGDKGRIAMIGTFGALAVIAMVIVKTAKAVFNIDLVRIFNTLPSPGMHMLIVIEFAVALLLLSVSARISILILNKKEF